LPVDAPLFGVRLVGPRCYFSLQSGQFSDPAIAQALACQATQLAFGDIQPASMFRGVTKLDSFQVSSRTVRLERFIKRSFSVRVEVVANECHTLAIGVARIQHLSDFDGPVGLGPPFASGRLSETRERFGEQEAAKRSNHRREAA
jgi:hypothetical protein